MKEVLEIMIKNLVDNADAVSIKELNGEKSVVYEVKVAEEACRASCRNFSSFAFTSEDDMGKVIGKQGRVARAVRAIMKSVASKENKKVTIEFIN